MGRMTVEEYNQITKSISFRIGRHIILGGSCDDEYVKELKEYAEGLSVSFWRVEV